MNERVPKGWEKTTLCKIVGRVTSGGTPRVGRSDYYGGAIPFLKINDLTNSSKIINSSGQYITGKAIKESSAKIFPAGTIITTIYGTIGVTRILGKPMATNQAIAALLDLQGVTSEFLLQKLNNDTSKLIASSSQTTQTNVSASVLKKHIFLLPPLPEQRKIASILASVDEVIENTQKQINKLQDLKKATMNELLTKGIGHTKFKDSELGRIPNNWNIKRVGDICKIHYGKSSKQIMNNNGSFLIYGTGGIVGKTNSIIYEGPSIIIGRKGTIDKPAYVKKPFWAIDTTYYVESMCVNMKWLYYRLNYENLKKYNEASGVPSLNRETLYSIILSIPPIAGQGKQVKIIDGIDKNVTKLKEKLTQIQSLKKSLMQDLLTGKIRVQT